MSGKIININDWRKGRENEVPDEPLELPKEVYNANWRDDVEDEAEDEIKEVTSFEPFENEPDYQSKEMVSPEAENLIWMFDRTKLRKFGGKTLSVYGKAA